MTPDQIARLQNLKDRLPNLQLLEGPLNQSKGGLMPSEWLTTAFPDDTSRNDYISRHIIEGTDGDLTNFENFYDRRRERLLARIGEVLNTGPTLQQ